MGLLDELTESPVGLGSGTFFIDEIFGLKVSGFEFFRAIHVEYNRMVFFNKTVVVILVCDNGWDNLTFFD